MEPSIAISDYSLSLARDTGMLAFPLGGSGLVVLDHVANAWFRMARMLAPDDSATLSQDGRYVVSYHDDSLAVWRLELPESAEAMEAWIDRLTNGVPSRGAALAWQ